jgi:hypothetical protein
LQGKCANAQEEDRCDFTTSSTVTIAGEGIRFVLGHALAMKAIHGSMSKNDKIDSHKIAPLLRGGLLPQSYVYPAAMRSTRDLLRRRLHLVRQRGPLLAHIQHTRAQYQVPELARRLAYPANRDGVAELLVVNRGAHSQPTLRMASAASLGMLSSSFALMTGYTGNGRTRSCARSAAYANAA